MVKRAPMYVIASRDETRQSRYCSTAGMPVIDTMMENELSLGMKACVLEAWPLRTSDSRPFNEERYGSRWSDPIGQQDYELVEARNLPCKSVSVKLHTEGGCFIQSPGGPSDSIVASAGNRPHQFSSSLNSSGYC